MMIPLLQHTTGIEESEVNALPSPLREKVIHLVQEFVHSKELQTLFEKQKVETEQDIFEIRQKLDVALKQSENDSRENSRLKSKLKEIEDANDDKNRRLVDAQGLYDSALVEKNDCQRKYDLLLSEKEDLGEILSRRKLELEEAKEQSSKLEEQVKSLLLEKCKAQIKLDEVQSKELAVEHRENRWAQEKELMVQEKMWYMDEIRNRDQQIFAFRRDTSLKELEYETSLSEKDETLRQMRLSSEDLKHKVETLTNQIDDLSRKLKEAAEEGANTRDTYEKELQCQVQLAEVYKQSSGEAESKVEELTAALDGVKQLYSEAKESHFAMQEQMKAMQSSHEQEIENLGQETTELKEELEKANELLRSKHRVTLTDEEVAALSPGAAAASKLIKSGISLTQIYRDHCKIVEELEQQKFENKRLEGYIKELVEDITKKAPILKQQRDDYYETLDLVDRLKNQLNEVGSEQEKMQNEKDKATRQLTYTKAELERYQRDNADLSAQVRQLLQCLEKTRRGELDMGPLIGGAPSDPLPSAEDLVLFRDIDELQSQNQRLLSALREAEAKREEMVKAAQEAEMSKVRNELENAVNQLNALQDHRDKQNLILDTVSNQRDTYKKLCEEMQTKLEKSTVAGSMMLADESGSGRSFSESQAALESLNKEFDTYRKEKCEVEKLLNSKVAELSSRVSELQSTNVKLNAELEYQEQRFKILAGNTETYKKESKQLRERLESSGNLIGKHEQKVHQLTLELIENQEKLARMKIENRTLDEKLHSSKSIEQRLHQEITSIRSNTHSQEMLIASLQQLQSRLDCSEAEKAHKILENLDSMTRERNNLQHTLNTVTEQQQEYVRDSKAKMNDLRTKLEAEMVKSKSLESKLEFEEKCRAEADERAITLQAQLEAYNSSGGKDASLERFQKEAQQLQTRLNYLEVQHHDTKRKLEDANEKLKEAGGEISGYKRVAEAMETSLKNQHETDTFAKRQLESQLATVENNLECSTKELRTVTEEKEQMTLFLQAAKGEHEQKQQEANGRIERLEQEIHQVRAELEEWKKKEIQASADRDLQAKKAAESESKLLYEMENARRNCSMLENAQEEIKNLNAQVAQALAQVKTLQDQLNNAQSLMMAKESELNSEVKRLVEREIELETSRASLYEQVEKLGKQIAVLERYKESSDSAEGGLTASPEARNAETASSLTEVVGYLRVQLQEASAKAESADGERKKLENREKQLEIQLQRIKEELENSRKEASAVLEAEREKAQLISKLKTLEEVQEANRALAEDKRNYENLISELNHKYSSLESKFVRSESERQFLENRLGLCQQEISALKTELENWKLRHHELVEQRAAFESEQMNKLRAELDESVQKRKQQQSQVQNLELQLQQAVSEQLKVQSQLQDISEEKDTAISQLQDVRQNLETVQYEYAQQGKILLQARRFALKYKKDCEKLRQQNPNGATKASVEDKETETVNIAEEGEKEKELLELKEKCQTLEITCKELEEKCATLEKEKTSAKIPSKLVATINDLQKQQEQHKQSLETSGKQLLTIKAENRDLHEKLSKLQKEKQALESADEEKKFRLDALSNLHGQCEGKIQKLNEQIKILKEEKAAEKPSATTSQQSPVIQPVAALISADRSGTSEQRSSFRTGRSMPPKLASIRPMSTAQRTAQSSVVPPAVSPGPIQPDQSSSSSGVASVVVTPMVSTSQQPSTTSAVPHAFVTPHVEPQQEAVSASSDSVGFGISSSTTVHGSGISSSSNAGTNIVENIFGFESGQEASTSAADSSRKRPMAQSFTSDAEAKRSRPDSSEQVSTSDELAGEGNGDKEGEDIHVRDIIDAAEQPFDVDVDDAEVDEEAEESDVEEEVEVEGLDEDLEEDIDEEVEEDSGEEPLEGVDQPESSLSDSDEVLVIGTVDNGAYQGGPSHSVSGHSSIAMGRGFPIMLDEGDEGVVPSTPTLCAAQRPENEVSSAHVPQSNQFFEQGFLPFSTSEVAVAEESSGIQHNVPGTPGQGSPPQVSLDSDNGAATSTVNVIEPGGMEAEGFDFDQQTAEFLPREASEEPLDQPESDEFHGFDDHEVQHDGSEAVAAKDTHQEEPVAPLQEESNEPSTSQQPQNRIRIRKPIEWPTSDPSTSSSRGRGGRGRQTAKRSRGFSRGNLSRDGHPF